MTTAFPLLRLSYPVLMFYGTIVMEVWVDKQEELKLEMYTSGYVEFIYRHHISLCNTSGVPPMDYACWVMDVMHCKSIHQFRIAQLSHYNILPLLVSLPKINEVIAEETHNSSSPDPRLQKILKIVLPVSSAVTIPYHALKPEDLREIIRGNFDSVTVRNYSVDNMPNHNMKFSLNDLKMTNVKSLELAGPSFKLEDLNLYFKLWMKKKCNTRLEYLRVWQNGSVNKDLLLDELNAVQMPIRTNRKFKVLGNVTQLGSNEKIDFEFDITRADGRTATIRIGTHGTVSFYVWSDSFNNTTSFDPN
ncbi:hypothetical protein CRE_10449 [Caenorhabditis remanei]|uniref:Sdz-33 F-box domain-containing protein n=1 Tax=Caenorhabditis remanei TaxID=31234 RepID=E3N0K9_CAERE|nr:hypothetical protein CRE_10449 [Caenorhabditis remanei]